MEMERLEDIKDSIEGLTYKEKREFFSEMVPGLCESSLTKETCQMIFEEKVMGSDYCETFDQLSELHESARRVG